MARTRLLLPEADVPMANCWKWMTLTRVWKMSMWRLLLALMMRSTPPPGMWSPRPYTRYAGYKRGSRAHSLRAETLHGAGIETPLFHKGNTRMLFGDAKESIGGLIREFT